MAGGWAVQSIVQLSPLDSYITSDPFALGSLIDLMMEAARTSETTVDIQLRSRQYIPEDSELHTRRRENLKSHILREVWEPLPYTFTTACHQGVVFKCRSQLRHTFLADLLRHSRILKVPRWHKNYSKVQQLMTSGRL
jgi:hypothetical protein